MRISIALPTYNGAAHLGAQLQSFRDQRRLPDQLVISDDASSDATLEVAREFADAAPFRVEILSNDDRLGYNRNFERAIRACDGEIIALSDQDDVWTPDHLQRLAEPIEADPACGLTISDSDYVDEQLRPQHTTLWRAERFDAGDIRRIRNGNQFREWTKHHAVAGHALAFRASLRDVVLPFGNGIYDHWLSNVIAACATIVMVNARLTLHRHHGRQAVAGREVPLSERVVRQATVAADHFAGQIAEWQAIAARLESHRDRLRDPSALATLAERIALLERRRAMREVGPARRVARAMGELLAGRYHRSGRGLLTFARDVRG